MWADQNLIIKLKEDYIKEHEILKNKTQIGLSIHVDFHYLLTNDFQWLVQKIRHAILNELFDDPKFSKKKNRYILTFNIEYVKTGSSLELVLTIALIDPDIRDFLINLGIQAIDYLITLAFKDLKKQETSIETRFNLKKIKGRQVEISPDGKIKYFDGVEETFTFEQTRRRNF